MGRNMNLQLNDDISLSIYWLIYRTNPFVVDER